MVTQLGVTRLGSGRNFPLEVQNKGSGEEQGSSDGEEKGGAVGGEYLEEELGSGMRRRVRSKWGEKSEVPETLGARLMG